MIGADIRVVMDEGRGEGRVALEPAPKFVMDGFLLPLTSCNHHLPQPKILRILSILRLLPHPLYRLLLLLLLLPTSRTHLRHRRFPLLRMTHRTQLLLRLPLLPLIVRSYEDVFVTVVGGGGGFAGFGDYDVTVVTFEGAMARGGKDVAAVDATAAGIFGW